MAKAIIEAPPSHKIARGLRSCVLGENPLDVERLWRRMYEGSIFFGRGGAAMQAISGVDIALWDIAGQAMGQPIHRLLGGAHHTKLRAYASVLFCEEPSRTHDLGRRMVDAGFSGVKFGWGPLGQSEKGDWAQVRAARQGVGEQAEFMIDAGLCYDAQTAMLRAAQFAEFRPYWLEEPLHPDDRDGYRLLAERAPLRIAAGEQETTLPGFEALLEAGVAVLQPDVARVGGVGRAVEIGRLAQRRHRLCVNHCYKTNLSLAASLHFLAALRGSEWLEYCMEPSPLRTILTREHLEPRDGYVAVPAGPGLGVTLDEEVVRRYRVA